MLGVGYIRKGLIFALFSTVLVGCTVPVPFVHTTPSQPPIAALPSTPSTPSLPSQAPAASDDDDDGAPGDLWADIASGLTLHAPPGLAPKNPLGELEYGKQFLASASAQSKPYLYYVKNELDRRKLPYEIALIPLLESGYRAGAGSSNGPAGLWQLVPATGDRFGLQRNGWYDGRRDVIASTDAALSYFEHLRDTFDGDWLLAFAAYNCGERTIETAVERNRHLGRKTDVWSLPLSANTRKYLRRLLATSAVVADSQAFDVRLAHVPARPYFEPVDVGPNLPLERITAVSGLDADEFAALNPGFRRNHTTDGATRVLVRHRHGPDVALALSSLDDDVRRLPPAQTHAAAPADAPAQAALHTVKPGDTVGAIAARHGVAAKQITALNHIDPNNLRVGQVLNIPLRGAPKATPPADGKATAQVDKTDKDKTDKAARAEPKRVGDAAGNTSQTPGQHVVANGDNLWDLARQYGVSAQALAQANGITPKTTLKLGQKLRLPAGSKRTAAATAPPAATSPAASTTLAGSDSVRYEVRDGDSLWTISRRFNISVDELRKWNRLPERPSLQPGQRLVVNNDAT